MKSLLRQTFMSALSLSLIFQSHPLLAQNKNLTVLENIEVIQSGTNKSINKLKNAQSCKESSKQEQTEMIEGYSRQKLLLAQAQKELKALEDINNRCTYCDEQDKNSIWENPMVMGPLLGASSLSVLGGLMMSSSHDAHQQAINARYQLETNRNLYGEKLTPRQRQRLKRLLPYYMGSARQFIGGGILVSGLIGMMVSGTGLLNYVQADEVEQGDKLNTRIIYTQQENKLKSIALKINGKGLFELKEVSEKNSHKYGDKSRINLKTLTKEVSDQFNDSQEILSAIDDEIALIQKGTENESLSIRQALELTELKEEKLDVIMTQLMSVLEHNTALQNLNCVN